MKDNAALLLGCDGQLGFELRRVLGETNGWNKAVTALDLADCDFSSPNFREILTEWVEKTRPAVIINAAAYTAVDRAEAEAELALEVNGTAPGILGEVAAARDLLVIHYSTDYVFDGTSHRPYREDDPTNPLNVYGQSKLAGETALRDSGALHLIFRTSWVFGAHGGNFLKTMLRLASERETLSVVSDQIGAPTSAAWLAEVTARVLTRYGQQGASENFPTGLFHLTAAGRTSWHGYAAYLLTLARERGMRFCLAPDGLKAIPANAYPTPAARPANSCLDCSRVMTAFSIEQQHWQDGVQAVLETLSGKIA
ncbi:MAG: dTDP-4-dehydrorhamnose reductase [Betaproteobacteria bacterium]|nr:dTDP-4-dehydrorhamnose reductase [Betaproteobacteria bacterium]